MGILNFKRRKKHGSNDYSARQNTVQPYKISSPAFSSEAKYLFATEKGRRYEIEIQRSQKDLLCAIITFRLINGETCNNAVFSNFENSDTNMLRTMATVAEIVKMYMNNHPWTTHYEFVGVSGLNGRR
ncbi:MAG TPA: hypothetical protein EYN71_11535 [Flavobacteriales bacterium]|nr:hypothetical protein [Flavobacteriales bacterium]HIO68878.1 hypothetical protein [Flavobacteriales bacterium]